MNRDDTGSAEMERCRRHVVLLALIFLRVVIGYQPYSGKDNYHGSKVAYGGDYEAQRHWMEITYHLPLKEWYWYDLEYWGLDYPPLSAYQSFVCGWLSHHLVGPETVALDVSRGYEDPLHKSFMRMTVVVLDMLVYGSAVWYANKCLLSMRSVKTFSYEYIVLMTQPALLLIDHGHFQYNAVSLGLSIWAFYLCSKTHFEYCVLGAAVFCLALSFKQMTLYYSLAIFSFLLGRVFQDTYHSVRRFLLLAITVVLVLGLMFLPFVLLGPDNTSYFQRAWHVLRRIFPFSRGLFESKVANIWLVLSLKPFRIRQRIPADFQPMMAMLLTLFLSSPSCYKLFILGKQSGIKTERDLLQGLLLGTTCVSLSFFLASFQVHEKSILLVLSPFSLLYLEQRQLTRWFSILSTWSLWPLLVLDRLQVPYVCVQVLHLCMLFLRDDTQSPSPEITPSGHRIAKHLEYCSYISMIALHLAEAWIDPPANLPDIYPVLWSVVGCAQLTVFWLILHYRLYFVSKWKIE